MPVCTYQCAQHMKLLSSSGVLRPTALYRFERDLSTLKKADGRPMHSRYRLLRWSCLTLLTLSLAGYFPQAGYAQSSGAGSCLPATATSVLDANNVRAALYNSGALFWQGGSALYEVPKDAGVHSMFTTSLWVGGMVNDELRIAGSRYSNHEFWPGPLDANGNPPSDCTPYDQIYKITAEDIATFDNTGFVSPRLRDWPWHLGAPVIDGDGDPANYNLGGGDRPELLGEMTLWWVMNDRGNVHHSTQSNPMGLEVHVTAFSGAGEGDLDNTTFYRYKLIYKGAQRLQDTYLGFFVDADLGNFNDDYVGSDSTLGIAYIYNADNDDEGQYGANPPALGMAFLQGPLATTDGVDNDNDGTIDEADERMKMTTAIFFNNSGGLQGDPQTGIDYYNYMRGRWKDGQPFTFGGDGRNFSTTPTRFAFSGDPVTNSFWTEGNADGAGTSIPPSDRRFVMATGPFAMEPGETQEIGIAIVWARGANHLDSITQLRQSPVFQNPFPTGAFGADVTGTPPAEPTTLAAPGDGAINQPTNTTLHWNPVPTARGYLIQWATEDVFTAYDQGDASALDQVTTVEVFSTSFLGDFGEDATYFWRILPFNDAGHGTWSPIHMFTTSGTNHNLASIGFGDFTVTANANGPLATPAGASADWHGFPGTGSPANSVHPQQTNGSMWLIHTGRHYVTYHEFVDRVTRAGTRWESIVPYDYEIRFTDRGGKCVSPWVGSDFLMLDVPFELWRIGAKTPDDPSDDVRMFCHLFDEDANGAFNLQNTDHRASDDPNDPYTDWIYFALPDNDTPGEVGYEEILADFENEGDSLSVFHKVTRVLDRIVLVNWNGGNVSGGMYNATMPETGTVFRISTVEPVAPLLSSPTDGARDVMSDVVLWWHGTATNIEVALDPSFASPIMADTVSGQSHLISNLPLGQTYYWRVANLNSWSETWSFIPGGSVAASNGTDGLPTHFALDQNYPNPFNPETTFRFGLPQASHATINVYNALGQHIATVLDGAFDAGWHTVQWSASGLSSGLYFYQITAGAYQETRKMMLLK